jgi:16S rRNA (guanine966-N2)-methyltransferase
MRIISGTLKGRRIQPPKNLPVRPTTDRAKEGLFNILAHQYDFEACTALDLFAGTGSISYEFASRGVSAITAVDKHLQCVQFITKTSKDLGLPISPVRASVERFFERFFSSYTFVFADPPYAYTLEDYEQLVESVFKCNAVQKGGLLIIEHAEHIDLSSLAHFESARNYGGCVFSFFEV